MTENAKPTPSKPPESMQSRVFSGLAAFFLILLVLYLGTWALFPVLIAAALIAMHEFASMLRKRDVDVRYKTLMVSSILIILASSTRLPEVPWIGGSWREVALTASILTIIIMEVVEPGERPLERIVYSLFGLLYIPWLLGYFLLLRETPNMQDGFGYLVMPLIASFATDTGGLFFGRLFGRRKLAPDISPGKTVEGAIGGIAFSFVMVFGFGRIFDTFLFGLNVWDALLFSLLISSAAQLGDLAESLLKRALNVKDSGNFLPGHGGLLDRLDSLLFSVPVAYLFVTMVVTK
ncbi:phosphatidate cytidylyltransferase [Deinococcus cellulosilyticus]|uniref:Phosphatidate cytidylyltransferase n=1 Tax=Deinococcus cellulosilyticus (strain DSM 18568 / NBRC 106333 / KACC 11606 / 5516J-15) TaxID=1223518 RepID=A0A511N3F0_DEIC1|nr:phosphatidate cytidylyltransferase [Deinococcus cellulosilyticus]GEM47393.1 phosphatidate cytidylyltransferase [Deinococcus cellulosilyticus NBRC 106333 = KACC 11606]